MVDSNRLEAVVCESLEKALTQISSGARGDNFRDFADEFQTYWNRQKGITIIESFVEASPEPKIVQVFTRGSKCQYICDRESDLVDYHSGRPVEHLTQRNALFVPLPVGTIITPPHPSKGWEPKEATSRIAEHLTHNAKKAIRKLSRKLF